MSDEGSSGRSSQQLCSSSLFDILFLQTKEGGGKLQMVAVILVALLFVYLLLSKLIEMHPIYHLRLWFEHLTMSVPTILVETEEMANSKDDEDKAKKDENKVPCYDPSTGEYLGSVENMSSERVNELCTKASEAQKTWRHTTYGQRRQVLRTMQRYVVSHMSEIASYCKRDSGKTELDAILGEILTTCEKIRCVCNHGELWLRPQSSDRPTGPLMMHKTAYVEYVPLGVIGTIAPWNYPYHNLTNHIISAIFAGNAIVTKVSEHTSWSAVSYFARIARAALSANGHNPELCQLITGYGTAGEALVANPLVDKIIFTGSTAIGKKVMETASKYVKPVILELGGKDAMAILDDVKLNEIVPWAMRGCFQNSGQNCVGVERLVVYESIYQQFIDTILPRVKALRLGQDCGAMVTSEQLSIIQNLIDDAVSKGAKLLCGGCKADGSDDEDKKMKGNFYRPTVLVDVTTKMRIFHEEVFGPVMTIIKVPNDSDDECVKIVNDSSFGLGGSVYCTNTNRGLQIGRQIESGMMCINDFGSNYLVQSLPFGGVKQSGFGRFAGIEGLRALCLERSILVDKTNFIKTTIPTPMDYPVDPKQAIPFAQSLIQLFYNENIIEKIKAIFGLVKHG